MRRLAAAEANFEQPRGGRFVLSVTRGRVAMGTAPPAVESDYEGGYP